MSTKINVAGVWKSPTPSINVAGVWKTPGIKTNVAGVWKEVYSALSADIRADGRSNTRIASSGGCYSGAYWHTNSYEYEYGSTGSLTNSHLYTSDGPSNFWIEWNRTGGTLSDWNSLGAGSNGVRYQLSSNRGYRIYRGTTGASSLQGYFQIWRDSAGTDLADQGPSAFWVADYEYTTCPLCCFTPGTLVTMASGLEMPIEKVKVGDRILIKRPENGELAWERVGEVIERTDRTMYKIFFDDGVILEASDDHPLHVEGKGYACIDPSYENYKDIVVKDELSVGDKVTRLDGSSSRIVNIERMNYNGPVFTFSNSFWFANGRLVY